MPQQRSTCAHTTLSPLLLPRAFPWGHPPCLCHAHPPAQWITLVTAHGLLSFVSGGCRPSVSGPGLPDLQEQHRGLLRQASQASRQGPSAPYPALQPGVPGACRWRALPIQPPCTAGARWCEGQSLASLCLCCTPALPGAQVVAVELGNPGWGRQVSAGPFHLGSPLRDSGSLGKRFLDAQFGNGAPPCSH